MCYLQALAGQAVRLLIGYVQSFLQHLQQHLRVSQVLQILSRPLVQDLHVLRDVQHLSHTDDDDGDDGEVCECG